MGSRDWPLQREKQTCLPMPVPARLHALPWAEVRRWAGGRGGPEETRVHPSSATDPFLFYFMFQLTQYFHISDLC